MTSHIARRTGSLASSPIFGGMDVARFMRRYWQRRPLLVRQVIPAAASTITRAALFELAGRDDVESRVVLQDGAQWSVRYGPLSRRTLPKISLPGWTLLVQGVDLHCPSARSLLERFRFLPDARLDDVMVSWASDGGGVGPHVDSYDVFLLQLVGRRRWRVGPVKEPRPVPGLPLKILQNFEPREDWLVEPGDLLYLPPGWGHDGVAEGACMTASIGFRAPTRRELTAELLGRLGDSIDGGEDRFYRDAGAAPTSTPGLIPPSLRRFASAAVRRMLTEPDAVDRALGEYLTEPKPRVWFNARPGPSVRRGVTLAPASRMMYDMRRIFINGESFHASGRDAVLMQRLADERELDGERIARASTKVHAMLTQWLEQGWLLVGARR